MNSIALPRLRSRRRKPWRPITWVLLVLSVVCHVESGISLAACFAHPPTWYWLFLAVASFVAARICWYEFQCERRKDES